MDKDNTDYQYWKSYYDSDEIIDKGEELQLSISRTRNGSPISDQTWNQTIIYILQLLDVKPHSSVLELCCGNGLVLGELAKKCHLAYGVDYSEKLLKQFSNTYNNKNIHLICSDANTFIIEKNKFDIIIIYFSIQHFNERDTFILIEKCLNSISPKGRVLIGDIPDLDKKWTYIAKEDHQRNYFNRLVNQTPMIGHWFKKDFFLAMNSCFDFAEFKIVNQPAYQINSDYRFDVLITKK